MTVMINILNLSSEELVIQPCWDRDRYGWVSRQDDPSTQFSQLKEYLLSLGLKENVDFIALNDVNNGYRLKFQGKAFVLRALYTIPQDKLNLIQGDVSWAQPTIRLDSYLSIKNGHAMRMTEAECFVSDAKFVKQADNTLLDYIVTKVNEAHKEYSPRSALMNQLTQDLAAIEKYQDNVFDVFKTLVALASVLFAYREELKHETGVAPYKVIKGKSTLAPKYKAIMDTIAINIWGHTKINDEPILAWYHDIVVKRRLQPVAVSSAPANLPANAPAPLPLAAPGNATPAVDPVPLQKFTVGFYQQFKQSLISRRNEIQKRMDNGQWFQDANKNRLKKEAINRIVTALEGDNTPQEISKLINANREVLTQSTSTLPTFFRNKVSSASMLEDYGRFLSFN